MISSISICICSLSWCTFEKSTGNNICTVGMGIEWVRQGVQIGTNIHKLCHIMTHKTRLLVNGNCYRDVLDFNFIDIIYEHTANKKKSIMKIYFCEKNENFSLLATVRGCKFYFFFLLFPNSSIPIHNASF